MFDSRTLNKYHHRHVSKSMDNDRNGAGVRQFAAGLQQLSPGR
jgi:hypothetical protein